MTDDGDRVSSAPQVLRALVDELRASEPAPIAWDDMEARLMAQIDRAPRSGEPMSSPAAFEVGDTRAEILVPWDDDPIDVADHAQLAAAGIDETTLSRDARSKSVSSSDLGSAGARGESRTSGVEPRAFAKTSLLARVVRSPARGGRSRTWAALAAVAALAAAAAWMVAPGSAGGPAMVAAEPVDLASVAVEPRLGDAFDLASLRAGDVVEASEGPVTFGRAGILRWTLSAGGRVRVVTGVGREEPRHVVALEAGALEVDVVPLEERRAEDGDAASGAERFVVEVGDARVAVHGTAFRVVRSSRGVVLDVTRGVVAVGPRSESGSARLVEAPTRASFALDGSAYRALPALAENGIGASGKQGSSGRGSGSGTSGRARETVARDSGDERYAGVVEDLADASGGVASDRPAGPTPAAPKARLDGEGPPRNAPDQRVEARGDTDAWTAERVRREVSSCIARTGEKSGTDSRVTIASSLVVDVDAAGSARAVRFDPPIRPDLQVCGQPVLQARFPAGTGRLLVPLEVRLGPSK